MKYILRIFVLGDVPEVEIDEREFRSLQVARKTLRAALSIEEKYEFLVTNYLALENQLMATAVTDTVRAPYTYSEIFGSRSALNLCLVNLLTSTRLYLDQLPQDIADVLPLSSGTVDVIRSKGRAEYDKHFEYRLMEAMRNHVQHRGTPIHYFSQNASWTSLDEHGELEFTIDISAQRAFLEDDDKFKKQVLDEMPESVSLKAATRQYVESISFIHQTARDLISKAVDAARQSIDQARTRYSQVYKGNVVGLAAAEMKCGEVISQVPLLLEWDDVRIELQRRNRQLSNLSKRFATSRIPKKEATQMMTPKMASD